MSELIRKFWVFVYTLLRWKQRLLAVIKPSIAIISKVGISIVGIGASVYLYIYFDKYTLFIESHVSAILLGVSGAVATMLALVLSLSIIPIQKAVESYSPSVMRIIKKDKAIQSIYVLLALICIFSLILSGTLEARISLVAGVVLLSISLDLLRGHYRRVLDLLSPLTAISLLTQNIIKYNDDMKRFVDKGAKLKWKTMSKEERGDASIEHLKSGIYLIYQSSNNYILKNWISELSEIAQRAINKGENYIAEESISAIVQISNHYLNVRKDTLITGSSPESLFTVIERDVDEVLNASYEKLKDLNTVAVASKNESICIHILRAYGAIAIFSANLKSPRVPEYKAPGVYAPIFYMNECVKLALPNSFLDVGLQGARICKQIIIKSPIKITFSDIIKPATDNIYGIAVTFVLMGKGELANEAIKELLTILHHLLKNEYHDFDTALRDFLEEIEVLLPLALKQDKRGFSSVTGQPPYDLSNNLSLGYLMAESTKLIKKIEDKPWINPYGKFEHIGEALYRHFRNIAEKVQFGQSFLLWHIIHTLKHITKVYDHALQMDVADDISHKQSLTRQLTWFYSFTWAVFKNAENIHYPHADEACDMLSWSGLLFASKEYFDVTNNCVSNICSVSSSYFEKTHAPNPFNIADLLMSLWNIRVYAASRGLTQLIKDIDGKFTEFSKLSGDSWKSIAEAMENRKSHLERRLTERNDDLRMMERADDLLKNLLKSYKGNAHEDK